MTIIQLEDLSDRLLRPYSGMTDGQLRRGEGFRRDNPQGLFIGESGRVIERALDAGVRPVSVLVEERWLEHDRAIIERIEHEWPDCRIFLASVSQFRELTGYEVVRGALACFERPAPLAVDDVIAGARRIAILEDVTNYANMGAIFRSAAALGMDGVLVTPACHDPYYRRCARVSMGAVFQVPWARIETADATAESGRPSGSHDWAPSLVPHLREAGFVTVAMALREDSIGLRDPRLAAAEKLAIVLGTEGDGLLDSTIEACDHTVLVPMAHQVDSLNVAAAAAIAFWELGSASQI
ncbi:MAG: RNA methyltransferase [Eggerthellaceae bacterium]|nr:RNA methyltransferase [Eggerthellaceae bacterium]